MESDKRSANPTPAKRWWEIAATLTPLITGVLIGGAGLWFTHVFNDKQVEIRQIELLDKFRELLKSKDDLDRQFAYEIFAALGHGELAVKLIQMKQDVAGRAVLQEVKKTTEKPESKAAEAALKTLPLRVYIQIAGKDQREHAQALREALIEKGYIAPGIEVVGPERSPKVTGVRFFNEQDKDWAAKVEQLMKAQGYPEVRTTHVSQFSARPGSVEIWLSPGEK